MSVDFGDIKGMEAAKRAAIVAMVGGHELWLVGGRGAGKSMLAQAMRDAVEHCPRVVEMWPCPCGNLIDARKTCQCSTEEIRAWWNKSADEVRRWWTAKDEPEQPQAVMMVEVVAPGWREVFGRRGTDTACVREQVERKWAFRKTRTEKRRDPVGTEWLRKSPLDNAGDMLLRNAYVELGWTVADVVKCLGVARSIADLCESPEIKVDHVAEATMYSPVRRWDVWGGKTRKDGDR